MKISKDISQRITILRFPLIIGVVFIHSSGSLIAFSEGSIGLEKIPFLSSLVQNCISNVFARIAVPMFFLISGFLFFQNFALRLDVIKSKFKRRINTLLIPYIFWNSLALLTYFILQSIPALNIYFSGNTKLIIDYGLYDYLNAFLALKITANSPIAYQFWFIRDLIILVIFSPLIWLIVTRIPIAGFVSLLILWLINPRIPHFNVSQYAIFFYYSGALLSSTDFRSTTLDVYGKNILIAYLLLAVFETIVLTKDISFAGGRLHSRLILLPGIISAWYIAGKINQYDTIKKMLMALSGSAFFLYAAHEPFLLAGLRKIMYKLTVPRGSFEVIAIYFMVPLMTIGVVLIADNVLKKTLPAFYNMISGSR